MKEASLQWSKGSRMCPGLFLATMELKMVIATLVSGWQIDIGSSMKPDTMDMVRVDGTRCCDAALQCLLIIKAVQMPDIETKTKSFSLSLYPPPHLMLNRRC